MLFNSFDFVVFFIIVTTLYFTLPHKYRWFHLLAASSYFYMAFVPIYILILFFTIVIDYVAGILIENAVGAKRRTLLIVSLVSNIGILAVFKYYNFIAENINSALDLTLATSSSIPLLNIILPIGLSFHTFQAMSYTIEVYRGNQKAERHFGIYALYVMFYPQLVAGPIERPQNMLHQFHEKHDFNFDNFKDGLKMMLWGLFKKVVIADRLAMVVNVVYKHPEKFNGPALSIATLFFAFQIYCDFSGYSEIALGAAKVMGFNLMVNFNRPYSSRSISEFWTRWHISLSTWFKDYLYIPLGGNRVTKVRNYMNLSIVFIVSGLWHGANWTYVAWGTVHAFFLVFGNATKKLRVGLLEAIGIKEKSSLNNALSLGITFFLAILAWVFFRANNMHSAIYVITHAFTGWGQIASIKGLKETVTALGEMDTLSGSFNVIFGLLLILLLETMQSKSGNKSVAFIMDNKPKMVRWGYYYLLIISILLIGAFENQEFIYFQF